jgi:PKHD-type hydroxylase
MDYKKPFAENISWPFFLDCVSDYVCYEDLFSYEEAESIINHAKTFEFNKAKIAKQDEDLQIRDNEITFLGPHGIEWAFQKLAKVSHEINQKLFKFDTFGFIEGLQFTQYTAPKEHYSSHTDKIFGAQVRKLSVVIQLTDENEYEGCDLELIFGEDKDTKKMPRKKGTLIMFPSYVLHRVTPITKGQRHSLVGWITGKPFV